MRVTQTSMERSMLNIEKKNQKFENQKNIKDKFGYGKISKVKKMKSVKGVARMNGKNEQIN